MNLGVSDPWSELTASWPVLSFASHCMPHTWSSCACSALERTRMRVVSYEDQVTALREQLSEIFAHEQDWTKAAQLLAEIDLDSGMATVHQNSHHV